MIDDGLDPRDPSVTRRRWIFSLICALGFAAAFRHARADAQVWAAVYVAVLVALIWIPAAKRTPYLLAAAAAASVGCAVAVRIFNMSFSVVDLLIPYAAMIGGSRTLARGPALGAIGLLIACGALAAPHNYAGFANFLFPFLATYLGVLGGRTRREARRLDQLRLRELEAAHAELQQAHAALQETTMQAMQSAALAERASIARDIHDGLGHHLTSLIVQLQTLELMLPQDPEAAARRLPDMLSVARQALSDVRSAVRQWADDDSRLGLSAMRGLAHQVAGRARIACEFHAPDRVSEWPTETSVALYRVLQEALTNVLRHAQAERVDIAVAEEAGQVKLTIADDGVYTAAAPFAPGFGFRQMQERCRSAGGALSFSANGPHGLVVSAELPL